MFVNLHNFWFIQDGLFRQIGYKQIIRGMVEGNTCIMDLGSVITIKECSSPIVYIFDDERRFEWWSYVVLPQYPIFIGWDLSKDVKKN